MGQGVTRERGIMRTGSDNAEKKKRRKTGEEKKNSNCPRNLRMADTKQVPASCHLQRKHLEVREPSKRLALIGQDWLFPPPS